MDRSIFRRSPGQNVAEINPHVPGCGKYLWDEHSPQMSLRQANREARFLRTRMLTIFCCAPAATNFDDMLATIFPEPIARTAF
jgi:hypothetical protein